MSRHSQEDIEARNSPLGRAVAFVAVAAAALMLFLFINAAINPPTCTRVQVTQWLSLCL